MEDARALLNGLMGADRNANKKERRARKFSDDDVCRKFLLGLCPHEMFTNTKMDLGPCGKHHNEHLKEAFEADSQHAHYRRKWRGALRVQLKQLLGDVDRRIETNQARIQRERECGIRAMDEQERLIVTLKEEVSEKLKEAEKMADDGNFEDSRAIMKETEMTKRQIEDLELKSADKYEKEHVCNVCGQIVSAEEAKDILKYGRGWHTDGKQHIGFNIIRKKLKELDDDRASDRQKGIRTPSPSPIKAQKTESNAGKATRASSPAAAPRRVDGRRRKASHSRSPRRKRTDDRRRRTSRSRSWRPEGNRTWSPTNGRRSDGKRRPSPSPRQRSRSPVRRECPRRKSSRSRKRCSPSREQRRRSSPWREQRERYASSPRRSRSLDASPLPGSASPEVEGEEKSDPEAASKQLPVRFVLGLGKLNMTSLPEKKRSSDASGASEGAPPAPSDPARSSPDGKRAHHRRKRSRRAQGDKVSDTERSAARNDVEPSKPAGDVEQSGEEPARPGQTSATKPPPDPPPEPAQPPRAVRFVLGLGKLNMTALKK